MYLKPCVMGCLHKSGSRTHRFPCDPERRAHWEQLLGIKVNTKYAFICNKHFSGVNFYGNRLSRNAMPDRHLTPIVRRVHIFSPPHDYDDPLCIKNPPMPIEYTEEEVVEEEVMTQDSLDETLPTEEPLNKIQNFEITNPLSKDLILKGRYIQLKDYLVVSYTTQDKLTLKRQVEKLRLKCDRQGKQIKLIKSRNLCLSKDLYKYKKLAKSLNKSLEKANKKRLQNLKKTERN